MSEALRKAAQDFITHWDSPQVMMTAKTAEAIGAIRAALAEPEQSEPVAWQVHPFDYGIGHEGVYARTSLPQQVAAWERKGWTVQPLYTAAPLRRVPLTREQVRQILASTGYGVANAQSKADFVNGIRHGEVAHGIGVKP